MIFEIEKVDGVFTVQLIIKKNQTIDSRTKTYKKIHRYIVEIQFEKFTFAYSVDFDQVLFF